MAAKFEIDVQDALRNVAALQAALGNVGKHLDDLNRKQGAKSSGLSQMVNANAKYFDELGKAMKATGVEARKNGEAISSAMVKAEKTSASSIESIVKANHKATIATAAWRGELGSLGNMLADTANKKAYIQGLERAATLQTKLIQSNELRRASLEQINTAEGKLGVTLKERLASETRMAGAAERQAAKGRELTQALQLQNTEQGRYNEMQKARLAATIREQGEATKYTAKMGELTRTYASLNGGMAQNLSVQTQLNRNAQQSVTFRERELGNLAELQRRQDSLRGGTAAQIATQRAMNSARESSITYTIREGAALDTLRNRLTSLNGGQAEQMVRLREQIRLRTDAIRGQESHSRSMAVGSQVAASFRAALTGLGASFGMYTSGTIVAASATYTLFNAMRSSIATGAEFTAAMSKAAAIMNMGPDEASQRQMAAMEEQVRALGQTTVFTASEVAQGLIELGQAGLTTSDAILALRPALDLAQIGGLSMAESADIATNVMMIFGKQAKDLTGIVDLMAAAATDSNATVQSLANTLSYAGPAAHAAGISLEETAAAAMVLHNAGIKSSRSGTALRKLFTSLLNPTEKGAAVLNKYQIATQNVDGSTRDLSATLLDMNKALNASSVSEAERLSAIQDLVGLYATSSVAALVEQAQNVELAQYNLEAKVKGSAERMRKMMADNLVVDWKTTKSAYEELQLQVFDKFEAYLRVTSAKISKYLLEMTDSIKVLNMAGVEQSVSSLVARANNGSNKFTQVGDQVVNQAGDKIGMKELVASMDQVNRESLIVVNGVDQMVDRFETFGKVALFAIGGLIASRGFGGLSTSLTNAGADANKFGARMVTAAANINVHTRALGTMSVIAGNSNRAMGLLYGTMAAGSRAVDLATLAVGKLSIAMGTLAAWGSRLMAAFGWVSLVGAIGYAIYDAFSSSANERIAAQAAETKELEASYKELAAQIDAYGTARERAAMRGSLEEQVKTQDRLKNYIAELKQTKANLEAVGTSAEGAAKGLKTIPSRLELEIKTNEAELAKTTSAVETLRAKLQELPETASENKEQVDALRLLSKEYSDQAARVAEAQEAARTATGRTADYKQVLLRQEQNELDKIAAKLRDQATITAAVANSTTTATNVMIAGWAGVSAAITDAFNKNKNLSAGQMYDARLKEIRELSGELKGLEEMGFKQDGKDVGANLIGFKFDALKTASTDLVAAMAKMNVTSEEMTRVQNILSKPGLTADELLSTLKTINLASEELVTARATLSKAGQSPKEKIQQVNQEVASLTAELATLQAARQAASDSGDTSYKFAEANEKELDITKRLTSLKNEQASAQNSINKEGAKAVKATESMAEKLADFIGKQKASTDESLGEAKAYREGTAAVYAYQIQKEVAVEQLKLETANLKLNKEQLDELTKSVERKHLAEQEAQVEKSKYDMKQEVIDLKAQATAVVGGEKALHAYNVEKRVEQALIGKDPALRARMISSVREEAEALERTSEQLAKITRGDEITKQFNQGKVLAKQYGDDIKALEARFNQGGVSAEEYKKALQGLAAEYQNNQAQLTIWGKFTQEALNRVDEAFVDMWKNIGNGFGSFKDSLINSFKQMLAELAHAAITKPIMISFINSVTGSNKAGGISDVWGDLTGGSSSGGFGSITSMISSAKTVIDVAGSSFGKSVIAGWNAGGTSIVDSASGAIQAGGNSLYQSITSAFSSGSTSAASAIAASTNTAGTIIADGVQVAAGNMGAAMVDVTNNVVTNAAGEVIGTASQMTATTATSTLSTLSAVLSYIQGAYSIFQSFEAYGIAGAAVTGGAAAAGAMIGSYFGPVGTAVGFAFGAALGAIGADKWLGSGEKYEELASSASGTYSNGMFTDRGWVEGWKEGETKFGTATDKTLLGYANQFSATLGMLYDTLGNGADVATDLTMRRRRTSGNYSSTFSTTLDSGETFSTLAEYGGDVETRLTEYYDDLMGIFLAQSIVGSGTLPAYFRAQFEKFAHDWDSTAEDVIGTIEGVFTRFNGVNAALAQVKVVGLKLDENGLIASDSILNMVAKLADLDVDTATAKEKVKALTDLTSAYYTAFTSATDQFNDLRDSLETSFAAVGLKVPQTREAYQQMVKDIDVTTAAGQSMFTTLMGLATAADSYYSKLADDVKAYQEAFYSESERTAQSMEALRKTFEDAKLTLPATREGFRNLVDSIDVTTEAGRKLREQYLAQASAAGTYYDSLESALNSRVDASFALVQRSVAAEKKSLQDAHEARLTSLNDMLDTAQEGSDALSSLADAMLSALKALKGSAQDAAQMMHDQARATVENALAVARSGGDVTKISGLEDALSTISSDSTDMYGSLVDFNLEQARNANLVADLNKLTGKQLTADQELLKTIQDQIAAENDRYEEDIARLDAQLDLAQKQLDALNGVDNSVISVKDAMLGLANSITAALAAKPSGSAQAAPSGANGTILETVYQSILGRDIDSAGAAYWGDRLSSGATSYADLVAQITADAIANGELRQYAVGGLVVGAGTGTSDSVPAMLSNGEYVMTAAAVNRLGVGTLDALNYGGAVKVAGSDIDTSYLGSGSGNATSVDPALVKILAVLKQVQSDNDWGQYNTVKILKDLRDRFDEWDADGLPAEREAQ